MKWTIAAYLAAYLAMSAHVGYDYFTSNRARIERGETVQILEVRRYRINIDGREKLLTLAGENHDFNKAEHEIALKLVDEHQHFANEPGGDPVKSLSTANYIYGLAVAMPLTVSDFYNNLGNGRWYRSIDDIAEKRGYQIHPLENANDPFDNLSAGEKASFFGLSVFSALTAPLSYYSAKNEAPFDASKFGNFPYKESLLDARDPVMADGIVDLLREDEIDKLLAEIGRLHLEGVVAHLSKQVELQEIK